MEARRGVVGGFSMEEEKSRWGGAVRKIDLEIA
jgi:hypothetical protein